MSGRKRGRGQEWKREMMERETGVGEREIGIGQRERERETGMREREIDRDERERERERARIQVWDKERETGNYFITFLATFLFSRCYKLYIIYHNDSGEKTR